MLVLFRSPVQRQNIAKLLTTHRTAFLIHRAVGHPNLDAPLAFDRFCPPSGR